MAVPFLSQPHTLDFADAEDLSSLNASLRQKFSALNQMIAELYANSRASSTVVTTTTTSIGLTSAQVLARILLDSAGGGVTSATTGPTGPAGPQGVQGVQGIQGVPGLDGEEDLGSGFVTKTVINMTDFSSGDQVLHANFKPDTTQCFSWNSRSSGTVYQAASDGFVVGFSNQTGNDILQVLSDSSNPPTTVRYKEAAFGIAAGFCCPIRKGDFYEVTVPTGTVTMWFVPLGVLG